MQSNKHTWFSKLRGPSFSGVFSVSTVCGLPEVKPVYEVELDVETLHVS